MNRREFLAAAGAAGVARGAGKFYRVGERKGHWWFLTPEDKSEFSIAMNHIDSTGLRQPEGIDIWRKKYGNSEERWLKEGVVPDLKRWGFNSIGWTQEVVIKTPTIHRHSRPFSYEHYQWMGMPYCHLLPFAEFHQWEVETRNPDLFSKDWEEWCDYVARDSCQRMADDPKLIGYFYIDCPTWVHTRGKAPMFDPQRLSSAAGRDELFKLASRYYQVTHDAIRRYDKNHLILGDRYEAKAALPEQVVKAALPFVDVLSFQHFDGPAAVTANLEKWHKLTGKPTLLADASLPGRNQSRDRWGENYTQMIRGLRESPSCVGWHLCGAYLTNRTRKFGLKDELDVANRGLVEAVTAANRETAQWVATHS